MNSLRTTTTPGRWSLILAAVMVAVVAVLAGAGARAPAAQDESDGVAEVFAEQLDAAGIPGGAFVRVTSDGEVDARGVGTTGSGAPVMANTPFVIGSTTKSFTALAVMQLVEAGEVDLDAPVTRYVPELTVAAGDPVVDITVRHLLQHTSGLDDLSGGPILGSGRDGTALEAVGELSDSHLASPPGETWRYTNANYVLAGLVVEAASGQDYADYLQQHVLAPLGMDDTFVLEDPAVAQGHQYWFGFAAASGPTRRTGMVAAGYLASTADDLGRYLLMFLRGGTTADGTRLLSPGGIRTLSAPGPEAHLGPWADGGRARYAMGWMVGGPWAEPAVFHPGNSPDSSAMIALFPERELAAATLVPAAHELPLPGNPSITDRISRNTLHAVLGEPVPPATSVWGFYLWFDAAAIVVCALALWVLLRAVRAYGRPARPGRVRRWLRPLPPLLSVLVLLALPALVAGGWSAIWTWAPDLGLTVLVLIALLAAAGGLRLLTAARGSYREQPGTVS